MAPRCGSLHTARGGPPPIHCNMSEGRELEGLQSLGNKTDYKMDYAPEVLETFENKHPENDYWVRFNCP